MKTNYFNFKKYNDKVLITNDLGYWCLLEVTDFANLVKGNIKPDDAVYSELCQKRFIFDENFFVSVSPTAAELSNFKNYIRYSTSLHIFVLTNNCNFNCRYCQAQSENNNNYGYMTKDIALKAVDIALQSPAHLLSFEMQGGEPLLNFDVMKEIILYSEKKRGTKEISYTITTNGSLLSEEILDFFEKYKVSVSISLDGPRELHNYNRPMKNGQDSFEYIKGNVKKLEAKHINGGAVLTSTVFSLDKWKEIVDTYLELGFSDVFIRALTPLGYANEHWNEIGYTVEKYLEYYNHVLDYVIELNKTGKRVREMFSLLFLRKMLSQNSDNYMELRSPCGATIGQIAYFYDGNIYTCDEGRMIAQMGDDSFCLGNVFESSYSDLVGCNNCQAVCSASILEGLPGCSDCVYMPYCGVCPATTYALEGSIFSRTHNNYKCKLHKGIMDSLFERIQDDEIRKIFISWL